MPNVTNYPSKVAGIASFIACRKLAKSLMRWSAGKIKSWVSGSLCFARSAAIAQAGAVPRPIGSSIIVPSLCSIERSCSPTRGWCDFPQIIKGGKTFVIPDIRLTVFWKSDSLYCGKQMNCLGNRSLETGHNLEPTPPAIITGSIILSTQFNRGIILTKKTMINNN